MSSIERAMDKILDGDAPSAAAVEPSTAPVVQPNQRRKLSPQRPNRRLAQRLTCRLPRQKLR